MKQNLIVKKKAMVEELQAEGLNQHEAYQLAKHTISGGLKEIW